MLTDGQRTDARVIGILLAHLGAFGSGELKTTDNLMIQVTWTLVYDIIIPGT